MVTTNRQEVTRRYRERNREKLNAWNRAYAERRRRAAGMPVMGSPESAENRRQARKATGAEHGNWKGAEASYAAVHHWVKTHKPRTGVCERCGATPKPSNNHRKVGTEFANVSGEYRRDINDYIELCVSCHRIEDMTDEKRRKIGEASRGRPVSQATREKLRAATRRRWEQYRGE